MALAHVTALPGGGIADLPAGARRGTGCCVKSRDKQTESEYLHRQAEDRPGLVLVLVLVLMLMLMLMQALRPACRMLATDAAIWHTS